MIVLIDNYDSFSYNLYQLIGTINEDIKVIKNDQITTKEIAKLNPTHIVLSPGPGRPEDAGICVDVVKDLGKDIKILGVCLGHQAICTAYGGVVDHAQHLMHGKQSACSIDINSPIFNGLDSNITVARYHSLSLKESTLPSCLKVIARSDDKEIMAVEHKEYKIYGLQFHPESIMTPNGIDIIKNFLK